MYRVVNFFTDLKDNGHAYHPGDSFPHDGAVVSEQRLNELSGAHNRRGIALIEKIVDVEEQKPAAETVSEPKPAPKPKAKKPVKAKGKKVNKNAE